MKGRDKEVTLVCASLIFIGGKILPLRSVYVKFFPLLTANDIYH